MAWKIAISCVLLLIALYALSTVQFAGPFGSRASVETIAVGDLHALLAEQHQVEQDAAEAGTEPPEPEFVLVDVRSDAEISVSIIPSAITQSQYEANRGRYKDRTAIFYCTVGQRSGQYAKQAEKQGIHTKNFKGSILQWVEAGLPLVTPDGRPTHRVHTYSERYRDRVPAEYEAVTEAADFPTSVRQGASRVFRRICGQHYSAQATLA